MQKKSTRIGFVLGTRPEIIKMSPIIKACQERGVDFFIIHTGQHYSYEMDKLIFQDLRLPEPQFNLEVGSGSHASQTAKILERTEAILLAERPTVLLVQGDTNSVLAGTLAAIKLFIPVGHVEAGLRSYDRRMPEELNRVLVDHVADFLFVPTKEAYQNLLIEGIDRQKIFVTGNTIVDSVTQGVQLAEKSSTILQKLHLDDNAYFLLTLHRAENVDEKKTFTEILDSLLILEKYNLPIVWPVHPRTKARLVETGLWDKLSALKTFMLIDSVGFLDLLKLEAHAKMIITDSGGLQEEACILHVPCVTVRTTTERPESVQVGANYLAGVRQEDIQKGLEIMLRSKRRWKNPFGNSDSAQKIVDILLK